MINLYFAETENAPSCSKHFARNLLADYLKVDGGSLVILKAPFGKPYLRDYTETSYNMSHTREAILCAIAKNPIGVDMEKITECNEAIAEHFFTKQEQEYVYMDHVRQGERFAQIWTMKEAYAKWTGWGMALPFNTFNVLNAENIYSFIYKEYYISLCASQVLNTTVKIIAVNGTTSWQRREYLNYSNKTDARYF